MRPPPISSNWITNRNFDLLVYIGSCLTSYFLIYVNLGLGVSALLLFWFWIVAVDGPHIFGTISRTYLDAEEWRTRPRLLLGSLGWFFLGPLAVMLGIIGSNRLPLMVFLIFAQLWAYWHVVRQHYGFMTLYQRKNAEPAGADNSIDYWVFYALMVVPLFSYMARHPSVRRELGLPAKPGEVAQYVATSVNIVVAGVLLFYLMKEGRRVLEGKPVNLPKNLLLIACIPLHLIVCLHPYISTRLDPRLFAVFVTFYHNIQYHGIVWFYNRNRYGNDRSGEQFGWASLVSRNFLTYYAVGILFTLGYRYLNWCLMGLNIPFGCGPNGVSEFRISDLYSVSDLAIGFWWGFAFNHYYLDQKIWRVSRDDGLKRDLRIV